MNNIFAKLVICEVGDKGACGVSYLRWWCWCLHGGGLGAWLASIGDRDGCRRFADDIKLQNGVDASQCVSCRLLFLGEA